MRRLLVAGAVLLAIMAVEAASKPHVIAFGKAMPVKLFVGPTEDKTVDIKIRALYVDMHLREFTTGEPHDVTDRLFVVRRAFRLNDRLPEEERGTAKWKWEIGGWLLVDRSNGHVSRLNLPDFDPFYSQASWYRDLVAYCGIADNGDKLYAEVSQVGRKKPLLRKELGAAHLDAVPDSECDAPTWQRQPVRVTFLPKGGQKMTFSIAPHAVDMISEPDKDEESN